MNISAKVRSSGTLNARQHFTTLQEIAPGFLFALILAALSYTANLYIPYLDMVSPLLIAILAGVVVRNLNLIPSICEIGIKYSAKTILRLGVVLLGLGLSIPQVIQLGLGPIAVIILTVTAIFLVTLGLGKLLKVPHTTRVLSATGTAICGAAAVAGMSAVVLQHEKDDEDVEDASATAVACVTLFGTLLMFITPYLAIRLGLNDTQKGVWMGTAIHEVGQVVAAAKSVGIQTVTDTATITKLGRVALLAPLVALMGFVEARSRLVEKHQQAWNKAELAHDAAGLQRAKSTSTTPILPLFVVAFLFMVLLRSLLGWTGIESALAGVFLAVKHSASFILTLAMGAMGAGVNLVTIAKTGGRAILLGIISGLVAALVSLGLVLLLV